MRKDFPDHHDADLVLRLYDLRREPMMRQARKAILTQFWPGSFDDLSAITRLEHPLNEAYRQVASYWEMAFGMARHGIIQPDYLAEHGGEGLWLYAKVLPFLPQLREVSPRAYRNAEWLAGHSDTARTILDDIQARMPRLLAERKAAS
jgi:hypothetical protein